MLVMGKDDCHDTCLACCQALIGLVGLTCFRFDCMVNRFRITCTASPGAGHEKSWQDAAFAGMALAAIV